ncbi:MAG: hypothetical protein ABFD00_00525 [Chloroherpetonaceae bacterium]
MKNKIILLVPLLAVIITSCTVVSNENKTTTHQATQLETREFQTRMYDTNDAKLIMKALVNVLQDDGYIITNAVPELGVIVARKEIDLGKGKNVSNDYYQNDFWTEFFLGLAGAYGQNNNNRNNYDERTYQKTKLVEVSINVTEYGKQTKVRANFQAKILDNKGNTVNVAEVRDMKFYQDFYAKVDKSIFLQKNGL